MWNDTTRIGAVALAGIFAIAACGAPNAASSSTGATRAAESRGSTSALETRSGCSLLAPGEVETILGKMSTLYESDLPDGHWCSWKPAGPASITALSLTTGRGEDRYDQAMAKADDAGDLHDTDPTLGPLGFSADDGQNRTVGWVVGDQSVVLSLVAGDTGVDDLVVIAKAVNSRLGG